MKSFDVEIIVRGENKELNEQIAIAVHRYFTNVGFYNASRRSRTLTKAENQPHIYELPNVAAIKVDDIFVTTETVKS